ncbi:hypothetical protein SDC9_182550 [bioreactor metagenome]|uniref:Uncharacterized protein n=1 Tax=bioreactor metagenome TaxID=1076179 RepID=A0A645H972_9ZZZZ
MQPRRCVGSPVPLSHHNAAPLRQEADGKRSAVIAADIERANGQLFFLFELVQEPVPRVPCGCMFFRLHSNPLLRFVLLKVYTISFGNQRRIQAIKVTKTNPFRSILYFPRITCYHDLEPQRSPKRIQSGVTPVAVT